MKKEPYHVEFTGEADTHVARLSARDRARLLDEVYVQLRHEPLRATRNRGPMRPSRIGGHRLRIGHLRVYYDVDEPGRIVTIRAVGIKVRNRVRIGSEEIEL